MQIHYNLQSTAARPDHSVVEAQVDDAVLKAATAPVVSPGWLISPRSFRIPGTLASDAHTWAGDPRPFLRFLGSDVDLSQGFMIHSVLLHMHRLGQRGQVAILRASGKREVLLSIELAVQLAARLPARRAGAVQQRGPPGDPLRTGTAKRTITWARTRRTRCASASSVGL